MIKTYKVLALLLDYPTQELMDSLTFLFDETENEGLLTVEQLSSLNKFIQIYSGKNLGDWQREYVQQFDYSPQTNLYLFDYVYGDSKERGQAMIDLIEMYTSKGFILGDKELPDYLPAFLEYLAILDDRDRAVGLLDDIKHILTKITGKLNESENPCHRLIDILIEQVSLSKEKQSLSL